MSHSLRTILVALVFLSITGSRAEARYMSKTTSTYLGHFKMAIAVQQAAWRVFTDYYVPPVTQASYAAAVTGASLRLLAMGKVPSDPLITATHKALVSMLQTTQTYYKAAAAGKHAERRKARGALKPLIKDFESKLKEMLKKYRIGIVKCKLSI